MADGYTVEAALPLKSPGTTGRQIGFDIRIADASRPAEPIARNGQGTGARTSVATWNDPTGQSYQNTSRLGVLDLRRRGER